jgi:hypothetical protein
MLTFPSHKYFVDCGGKGVSLLVVRNACGMGSSARRSSLASVGENWFMRWADWVEG